MSTVPNFLDFTINSVLRPMFIWKLCYKLLSIVTFTFIQIFISKLCLLYWMALPRMLDTASKLALFSVSGLKDKMLIKSKLTWKLKHANSIAESFEYFCQISSKLILIILSYTVSKLVYFLRHSVETCKIIGATSLRLHFWPYARFFCSTRGHGRRGLTVNTPMHIVTDCQLNWYSTSYNKLIGNQLPNVTTTKTHVTHLKFSVSVFYYISLHKFLNTNRQDHHYNSSNSSQWKIVNFDATHFCKNLNFDS